MGALQLVEELARSACKLGLDDVDLVVQLIEEEDGGDRDHEAKRSLDERLCDTSRHGPEAARSGLRDPLERADDADDGSEEADERGDRSNGGEDAHSAAEVFTDRFLLPLRFASC